MERWQRRLKVQALRSSCICCQVFLSTEKLKAAIVKLEPIGSGSGMTLHGMVCKKERAGRKFNCGNKILSVLRKNVFLKIEHAKDGTPFFVEDHEAKGRG